MGQRAWVALAIIFALGFVHFWVRTTPVRLANPDDAVIQDIADTNRLELFARGNALDQARFHFATPLWGYTLTAPYKVHSPAAFSLLRALAWFAPFGLAGWLVARATRNPAWGAAVAFGLMSLLHIPPTFYAVLSYPPFWVGFCGVLAALRLDHGSGATVGAGSVIVFFDDGFGHAGGADGCGAGDLFGGLAGGVVSGGALCLGGATFLPAGRQRLRGREGAGG